MLRDAATIGFAVELETQERVVIPAGACAIDASGGARVELADSYHAEIDPLRARSDDLDPFPATAARVVVLAPGDRVEIHGSLVPGPDPEPGLYREGGVVLVPEGVAVLRAG